MNQLQNNYSQSLNDEQVNTESFVSEQSNGIDNSKLHSNEFNGTLFSGIQGIQKLVALNVYLINLELASKSASQNNSFQKEKDDEMEGKKNGAPISNSVESEEDEDDVGIS